LARQRHGVGTILSCLDRARFRQIIGVAASAGKALEKLKVLLDELESQVGEPACGCRAGAPPSTVRAYELTSRRAASIETLDGPFKLTSGERRILAALAQISEAKCRWRFWPAMSLPVKGTPTILERWGRETCSTVMGIGSVSPTPEFRRSVHGSRYQQIPAWSITGGDDWLRRSG
jgi:hypothetical protein